MKLRMMMCVCICGVLCSSAAYAAPEYYAPWPCGVKHTISQGNSDGFSHTGKYSEYAWDISMGPGDDIAAPLDGYVVKKVENFQYSCYNNGCTDTCLNSANYLILCLTDRNGVTFGLNMAHMIHNGIDVEEGEKFKQGQVIAHAGKTGCATGEHLHFTATATCEPWTQSIPSSWIDIGVPKQWQEITSNNCPKTCEPSPEVCDGQDNNCDGHVDEGEVCYENYDIKYQAMNYDPQNTDINGDGKADICGRASDGLHCMISNGEDYTKYQLVLPDMSDEKGWGDHIYYRTIRFADINGDGKADVCARRSEGIVCWPSNGTSFGEPTPVFSMSDADGYKDGGSNDPADTAYLSSIRFGDINGDKKDDFCARFKDGLKCYLSNGNGFDKEVANVTDLADSTGWQKPHYTSTIRMGDVDGDGKMDICARGLDHVYCWFWEGDSMSVEVEMNNWGWKNNWGDQKYYATIRLADINGDGKADICGRDANGIVCQLSEGRKSFGQEIRWDGCKDESGWGDYDNYSTIMFGDLNGDGKDDLCARANAKLSCYLSTGDGFDGGEYHIEAFGDDKGFNKPEHFRTLRMGDINGDGRMDVCGRGADGVQCFLFTGEGFNSVAGPVWTDAGGWSDARYYSTIRLGGPFGNPCSKREEICGDQIDNNCNGEADENCAPPCIPEEEVCDDKDNDCDGEVDEGLNCNAEPECVPEEEICDNKDNDCDGEVDEDLDCSERPECIPEDEVCDDKDNDCDGEVDEGLDCTPEPDCTPSKEICDDKDNDCDGKVDEGGVCDKPEKTDPPTQDPETECESPDGCEDKPAVDVYADEDCGCSIKRTPTPNNGGAWLFGILGMIGLAGLRRKRR